MVGFNDSNYWDPILKPNPNFDPNLQNEGVTCASCHLQEGAIVGPHPTDKSPHASRQDPSMTSGMGVCIRCHVTDSTRDPFSMGHLKICSTLDEIEARNNRPNCIGCHMPPITRPLVKGMSPRKGRKHLWRGAHSPEQVKKAISVTISKINAPSDLISKHSPYVQDVAIKVTNTGTHHAFPTGTPDRHVIIRIDHFGADKKLIASKSEKIIRRIFWKPVAFEWSDNRLRYGDSLDINFKARIKNSGSESLKVTITYYFLEEWRRKQIQLPAEEHKPFVIFKKHLTL